VVAGHDLGTGGGASVERRRARGLRADREGGSGRTDRELQDDPSTYVKAVNEWWGASSSQIAYAAAETSDVDALVEVSLQYAAFFAGALTLILRIKVIDPSSRAVIARNRDFEYRDIAAPEVALANDGEQFKRVFNDVAGPVVRSTLAGLGFKPA
jgi:hypothetical protein